MKTGTKKSDQKKKDALDLLFEGNCDLGELPEIETALRSIAFLIQCAALRNVNNETVNSGFAGLVNVCADAVLNVVKRESIAV